MRRVYLIKASSTFIFVIALRNIEKCKLLGKASPNPSSKTDAAKSRSTGQPYDTFITVDKILPYQQNLAMLR